MADIPRWSNPDSYSPVWVERTRIIAGFLRDCESVCDLGAGTQALRPLVRGYIPVDMVSLGPDTVVVNFDEPWSASDIPNADGYAMAGLLEHLNDPLGLIAKIAPLGRVWAVSYMERRTLHGRALLPINALEKAFSGAGMRIASTATWKGQKVYRLVRC